MIINLEKIGFAVQNVNTSRRILKDVTGLDSRADQDDPLVGITKAACIDIPNDCSIYLMESDDQDSSVYQYVKEKGPGLERCVFITDDILADYSRIRKAGIKPVGDKIFETNEAQRLFISADDMLGMAVEIQQPRLPKQHSARTNQAGVLGIQHIGMAVKDLKEADRAFRAILDIPITGIRSDQHGGEQLDGRIEPGNDHLILHVTQSWGENARVSQFVKQKGQGLEHICIEVKDIRTVIYRLREKKVPIYDGKIFTDRDDGFETFVYPPNTTGITIEFIEPFPDSIGYRYTL